MQCLVLSKHHGYTSSTLKRALQDLDLNKSTTYSLDISNIKLDPTHAKIIYRLSLSSIITAINLERTVYPPTHLVSFLQHNPLLRYLNIKGNPQKASSLAYPNVKTNIEMSAQCV